MVIKKGGKKGKKGKKVIEENKRKISFKEEDQEYCQVVRLLGDCRAEGNCFDGKTRICHIRGSMRKKVWVKAGNIVIVSLREFQDEKCDILHVYKDEEVKTLIKYGELPSTIKINDASVEDEKIDDGIDFEKEEDEEDEEDEIFRKEKELFKKDFDEKFNSI